MNGFKLLAIRPLEGCSKKYCKNLQPGKFYQFYQDYKFEPELDPSGRKDLKIQILPTSVPEDLFTIKREKQPDLSVNISAVVGKNGSGKSALFDLLYIASYVLIAKFDIPVESAKIQGVIDLTKSPKHKMKSFCKDLDYEIFFLDNGVIWKLKINGSKQIFCLFKKNNQNVFSKFQSEEKNTNKIDYSGFQDWEVLIEKKEFVFPLANYFYSIAINYSIYGLYGEEAGWLDSLFHKNDGYQTPLVINPYRYHGIINVKSEHELTQSRILVNVEHFNNDEILKGKRIGRIDFEFEISRLLELFDSPFYLTVQDTIENLSYKKVLFDLFDKIYFKLTNEQFQYYDLTPESLNKSFLLQKSINQITFRSFDDLTPYLIKYVIYKIYKLIVRDSYLREKYGGNFRRGKEGNFYSISINSEEELDVLVSEITNTTSHLTLKIRQAVFALRNKCFVGKKLFPHQNNNSFVATFKFEYHEFITKLTTWKLESTNINKLDVELIPAAFAKIKLGVLHDSDDKNESDIHYLSSGEQQLIITLQTLYYHLHNLNSVDEKKEKVRYRNVNIMMDEIELYFHPEYQRQFISELIRGLKKTEIPNIRSLNVLFSTHSPFILSDIPASNILRLENGAPSIRKQEETFGANIHQLLHNEFFLENGFVGEYGRMKINDTIRYLTYHINIKEMKSLNREDIKVPEHLILKRSALEAENIYIENEQTDVSIDRHEHHFQIINLIGEEVVKLKLLEMYNLAFEEQNA